MQKIGPCLWFDGQAEAAANFYVSVFRNSKITHISHFTEGLPRPAGSVMTVDFVLDGEEFMALNGGPEYKFSPAVSFIVKCDSQQEVDHLWQKLTEGGEEVQCGWLTDKFGVSWQIVPKEFLDMISKGDAAATQRAMTAMMPMKKLDVSVLRRAYENAC
jgi:predicted 3-demethylubiquinone-9 3-methyltransferase (glyoxalase superfamily)